MRKRDTLITRAGELRLLIRDNPFFPQIERERAFFGIIVAPCFVIHMFLPLGHCADSTAVVFIIDIIYARIALRYNAYRAITRL